MFSVLDSLNQLGLVAWKINKPLLDLIIEVCFLIFIAFRMD